MGRTLFPFNQYPNLYSRLLEKDDAENTFIASTEGANDPKVATEDDVDKSIGTLEIINIKTVGKNKFLVRLLF